ncbi:unnamed protein product [Adineta steineri]|uniref:Uncharacterized protein n=1 Tax=Adineta steineri TaxID=433720 RepID=A0A813ZQW9_9BILA|nr:unnamed protein product [Adineta steineri]CAF1492558.1 unnamed protein product [Adineta steineri]
MQVQVRTINVICAVLLVFAGFLIDNKVDARAIEKRSSDVNAEVHKRALIDALAHAPGKSYSRREAPMWTGKDTSNAVGPNLRYAVASRAVKRATGKGKQTVTKTKATTETKQSVTKTKAITGTKQIVGKTKQTSVKTKQTETKHH